MIGKRRRDRSGEFGQMENGSGVYLLFRNQRLVYVGRSKNPSKRIGAHRTNGRAFDYALTVPCPEKDVDWIERALIAALNPPQNSKGVTSPTEEPLEAQVVKVIYREVAAKPAPVQAVYSLIEAEREADKYGLGALMRTDVKTGALCSCPKNPAFAGPGSRRVIAHADLMAWLDRMEQARRTSGWKASA